MPFFFLFFFFFEQDRRRRPAHSNAARRRLVRRAACLLVAALGVVAGCDAGQRHEAATPAKRPNVLLYVIDTLRADHVGSYGHPLIQTPRIDAFAAEGVVYENAFSNASWTRPSIASLISGLQPPRHDTLTPSDVLPDGIETLAEILSKAGYRTAFANANPNLDAAFGFGPGFDAQANIYPPEAVKKKRDWRAIADSRRATELAIEWLAMGGEPWFLMVVPVDPHAPFEPPAEFDRYRPDDFVLETDASAAAGIPVFDAHDLAEQRARYAGEISANDASFGALLDHIDAMGQSGDTLVILASDHGEEFWEEAGRDGHGKNLSHIVTHVPLVLRYPASKALVAGSRVASPVQLVDVVPTVLELAGLDAPAELDGRSLTAPDPDAIVFSHLAMQADTHLASARNASLWLVRDLQTGKETWRRASPNGEPVAADLDDPGQRALRAALDAQLARGPVAASTESVAPDQLAPDARRALEVLGYVDGDE